MAGETERRTRVYPIMSQKFPGFEVEGRETFIVISFDVMDDVMVSILKEARANIVSVLLFRNVNLVEIYNSAEKNKV